MPARLCAVATCKNNRLLLKKSGSGIVFHSFPKGDDPISSTIRNKWVQQCGRAEKFNLLTAAICSVHFTPNDYERDLRNELLNLPLRRILKKTAVPSINLGEKKIIIQKPIKEDELLATTSSTSVPSIPLGEKIDNTIKEGVEVKRTEENQKKETIVYSAKFNEENDPLILVCDGTSDVEDVEVTIVDDNNKSDTIEIDKSLFESLSKNQHAERELAIYKEKYETLLKKYKELKTTSGKRIRNLSEMLKYYKRKFYAREPTDKKSRKAEALLKSVFTQNQINLLSQRKKKVNWTPDEFAVAFHLRCYSKQSYIYLRNNLKYPLPSLASLRRWVSQLKVTEEVMEDDLVES